VRFLVDLVTPRRLTLSAVVPNYNYARYLPQRLNSIFNQTTPPDEIIFLDDASTDDSVQIAQQILSGSAIPYRIIRNETNQGCYSQWLRGIGEATGDLVWLAEADDDCRPTLLEALTAAFDRDEVVLAFCQSKQIDGEGLEIAPDYLAWTDDVDADKWRHPYVRRGIDEIRDSLIIKNTIPNVSAVVMRRPDLSAIAGTLVGLRNAGDWMVYLHLLERGDIAFVPDALNLHRRHGRSVTIGKGGLNLMREILFVQRRALERHGVVATVEAKRQACLQTTYEYLGLNVDGPVAYSDHEALKEVLPAAAR
jgi:glycosyltransferase involved in cell wall biosynthesis